MSQQIIDIIRQTAQRYGVDPEAPLRIARNESGFNPNAKNPAGSAGGVFQFIDSTWNGYGNGGNKFDPAANIDAGVRLIRDNSDYLRRNGFDPTPGNVYLAHFAGPAGAIKILKNPNASARDLMGDAAVAANPFIANMNGGQIAGWTTGKMGGEVKPTNVPAGGVTAPGSTQMAQGGEDAAALADIFRTLAAPSQQQAQPPQDSIMRRPKASNLLAGLTDNLVLGD